MGLRLAALRAAGAPLKIVDIFGEYVEMLLFELGPIPPRGVVHARKLYKLHHGIWRNDFPVATYRFSLFCGCVGLT